jgi:hypothetical protein
MFVDHRYPATTTELIAAYGDSEIQLQNGTETIGDILGRLGEETFDDPAAVRDALMGGVSHKAIGRRFYSDRDQYTPGEHGPDPVSF